MDQRNPLNTEWFELYSHINLFYVVCARTKSNRTYCRFIIFIEKLVFCPLLTITLDRTDVYIGKEKKKIYSRMLFYTIHCKCFCQANYTEWYLHFKRSFVNYDLRNLLFILRRILRYQYCFLR